jgi:hypothetical protein
MVMEIKTRKLMITLELLALITAAVLILIDYKLKQDLLRLFGRIETAIETANRLHSQDADVSNDTGDIPDSSLVGADPTVEAATGNTKAGTGGPVRKTANQRTAANGNGRTRSAPLSDAGKSVGS